MKGIQHRLSHLARPMMVAAFAGLALSTSASANDLTCSPVEVAVFPKSRVHVRCVSGDGPILFFAVSVADSGDANRVLSITSAALLAKRELIILYDRNDVSGGSIGCLADNCRLIQGIIMK
jgi:hypothetical protein